MADQHQTDGTGERDVRVTDDPDGARFVLTVDGEPAGLAAYDRSPDGTLVFTHTEVDDRFEGQGLGTVLVRGALDAVRSAGGRMVPRCPFVAHVVAEHPEYADLTA